jgi:hypothetical protein
MTDRGSDGIAAFHLKIRLIGRSDHPRRATHFHLRLGLEGAVDCKWSDRPEKSIV